MDDDLTEAITVDLSDTQGHLRIDRSALVRLVRRVLIGEGVSAAEISVVVMNDAAIQDLNRRHLAHDWPTDVITFGLSELGEPVLAAEIIVSAEMAAATARRAGTDPQAELALYVVHGLLHLCGYDDQTPEAAGAMRRRETEVLAALGLPALFEAVGSAEEGPSCPG